MAKPGDRQIDRGKEFKDNTGSSPNGVANAWLSKRRGERVRIERDATILCSGILLGFDAYSMLITDGEVERLVFKGPGVVVAGDAPE